MSEKSQVPVENDVPVEKTNNDSNVCVDEKLRLDASQLKMKTDELDAAESVISIDPNIKNRSGSGFVEDDSLTRESSERVSPSGFVESLTETERAEVSDDGSDYKDAEVSKDNRQDMSDSESQHGSDSSIEGIRSGRRNRRLSNQVSKDNYSDDESLDKGENSSEPTGTRESGDGEEKGKDKVVDRDEDKKDPQYIPKKGVFYEHDDRTADTGPADTTEEPKDTKKKKLIADKIDRWGHDMFDNVKQSPKSTQDLIDFYGYDIRNEEEPPKAWRSRRYGRGPNKYTRQWQDEAAYRSKRPHKSPSSKPQVPFKNNIEDFPTVEQSKSGFRRNKNSRTSGAQKPERYNRDRGERGSPANKPQATRELRQEPPRRKHQDNPIPATNLPSNYQPTKPDRPAPVRETKYKDLHIEKTVFLNKKKPFSTTKTKSEAEAEADIAALSRQFSNAVINIGRDGKILPIGSNAGNSNNISDNQSSVGAQQVDKVDVKDIQQAQPVGQNIIPAASPSEDRNIKERRERDVGAAVSSKSKRYSSQRQRSLPQASHLPSPQQQNQSGNQQFVHQQQYFSPPPPQTAPEPVPDTAMFSGFQANPPPPVYPPDSMQGVVFLPGYPQPPPAHLLPAYCPAPQQFGMPPPLGPPPPDMYPTQPPPGITYYSPQSQVQPRPPASRRVKVAIPIVAPPDQQHQSDQTCS